MHMARIERGTIDLRHQLHVIFTPDALTVNLQQY
jgi:hypothetical protein